MQEVKHRALVEAALSAAETAYAPYSGFRVGAAIEDANGRIFSGCNVENAAFPLGACAEQSAISDMIRHHGTRIARILIATLDGPHCPPCGGCRQRIMEFADEHTEVVLYASAEPARVYRIRDLLPDSFQGEDLKPR